MIIYLLSSANESEVKPCSGFAADIDADGDVVSGPIEAMDCPFGNTVRDYKGEHRPCGTSDDNGDLLLCGQCKVEAHDASDGYEEF